MRVPPRAPEWSPLFKPPHFGVLPLVTGTLMVTLIALLVAVPQSIREASLALGATQWQTIWRQVLPAAAHGVRRLRPDLAGDGQRPRVRPAQRANATVRDGRITRYHLYEDSYAVAKAYFDD